MSAGLALVMVCVISTRLLPLLGPRLKQLAPTWSVMLKFESPTQVAELQRPPWAPLSSEQM